MNCRGQKCPKRWAPYATVGESATSIGSVPGSRRYHGAVARVVVPLRFRLPNPPAVFVGRKAEGAELADAIRRAPVAAVWGLGGSGKTALVLQTLHRRFARKAERTLFVGLRPGTASPEVEVARVLAEATKSRIEWAAVASAPDAAAALAIDLAETGPWWLVIEDLQHAPAERVAALLSAFARYARRSRVIATSRFEPDVPELRGQTVTLGAMDETELARLAQIVLRLDASGARQAARAAQGSPWRLLQGPASSGEDALGLAPEVVRFLAALAAVEVPIPREAIDAFAPSPGESTDSLARRGLLERGGAGYRVHDVVRGLLPAVSPEETDRLRAAAGDALAALPDPTAAFESVRLLLAAGRFARASQVLDERLDGLLAAGFAPRLWEMLAGVDDGALAIARLRCAVDLGSVDAISRVRLTPGAPLRERFEWAGALRLRGDLEGAVVAAGEVRVAAERAGDRTMALEAALLCGRCRIVMGAASDVFRELESVVASTADEEARRDALLAQAMTYVGRTDEALRLVREMRKRLSRLSPPVRAEVGTHAARVLYDACALVESAELLDEVLELLGASAMARYHGRVALHLKMYIAQDLGLLHEARSLHRRLEPMTRGSVFLSGSARSVESTCRIAAGDLAGLDEMLAQFAAESASAGHRIYLDMALLQRTRLATIEGRRFPETPADGETPDPVIRWLLRLHRIQNALLHGDVVPRDAAAPRGTLRASPDSERLWPTPGESGVHVEVRVLGRIVSSQAALLRGDAAGAIADARTALEWAREVRYRLAEVEALLALLDALVVAGRDDDVGSTAAEAGALAASIPSPRLAFEAALARAVALGLPDIAVLEPDSPRFAAPVAARRGRALLGEPGAEDALDALDRVVVRAVLARSDWRHIETLPSGAEAGDEAGWGLDEVRHAVWLLPDGRTVSFEKRRLPFRVLLAIADEGGRATKEALVTRVWGEREYHRLKHDNRLHLAILKARRAIEEDPANPARVLATDEGYALAGRVRRRRA